VHLTHVCNLTGKLFVVRFEVLSTIAYLCTVVTLSQHQNYASLE